MITIGLLRPFKLPFLNKMELMNEFTVLIINYHFLCFTAFVPDVPTRIIVGYSIISITGYVLVVNIGIVLVQTVVQTYKKLQKHKAENSLARLLSWGKQM